MKLFVYKIVFKFPVQIYKNEKQNKNKLVIMKLQVPVGRCCCCCCWWCSTWFSCIACYGWFHGVSPWLLVGLFRGLSPFSFTKRKEKKKKPSQTSLSKAPQCLINKIINIYKLGFYRSVIRCLKSNNKRHLAWDENYAKGGLDWSSQTNTFIRYLSKASDNQMLLSF